MDLSVDLGMAQQQDSAKKTWVGREDSGKVFFILKKDTNRSQSGWQDGKNFI